MLKMQKYDVADLLGVTPIVKVSDSRVWSHLVTPQVRALIGPISQVRQPVLLETEEGLFPGDRAFNLNDHRLYGGQRGFVRQPYLATLYQTAYGALLIKRDCVKIEVTAWCGEVDKGKAELIYEVALRDRRFDGTRRANESALVSFPFDDPALHKRLTTEAPSVEASLYGFMPGSRIADVTGEPEFEEFVRQPYKFLNRTDQFLTYFERVWKSRRGPGQVGAPIPDVSKVIIKGIDDLARSQGYDFVEATTSHYNVALFTMAHGYRLTFLEQAQQFGALNEALKRLKEKKRLTRTQESWVCVLQSLSPLELIPAELYLGGPNWPWDNICKDYLWLNKPLTERAKQLVPGQIQRS